MTLIFGSGNSVDMCVSIETYHYARAPDSHRSCDSVDTQSDFKYSTQAILYFFTIKRNQFLVSYHIHKVAFGPLDRYFSWELRHARLTRDELRGLLSFSPSVRLCGQRMLDKRKKSLINQIHTPPAPYRVNWHCKHSSHTQAAAPGQEEGEGTQGRLLATTNPPSPTAKEPDDECVCASVFIPTGQGSFCIFQHV